MSERAPSPELLAFYERMEAYIWEHPEDPARAVAAFPGWEADPQRVGIYGRFIRGYADDVTNILFSDARAAVEAAQGEERWTRLLRDYYATRPGVSHDLNQYGAAFPEFVRGQDDLPAWLPNLALHEWTRYGVTAAPTPIPARVEALTANPTLEVLQLAWRISSWAMTLADACDTRQAATEPPEAGEELTLIWRHPKNGFSRYIAAGPRTLLVLKMAAEGIAPEAAAEAGGVPLENVEETLAECVGWGLVLRP